jgi:hypothetical protein
VIGLLAALPLLAWGAMAALPVVPAGASSAGGAGPEPPLCIGAACPDLRATIEEVRVPGPLSPAMPRTTVVVRVANAGGGPAAASKTRLTLYASDGRQLATTDRWTPPLASGQQRSLSLAVAGRFAPESHCLLIQADSGGTVAEADENNVVTRGHCAGG